MAALIFSMAGSPIFSCGSKIAEPKKGDFADLVLFGGKIATMSSAHPTVEALAVKGDVIAAVGTKNEIQRFIGPQTRVIELKDGLAVPGLIESHAHFLSIGAAHLRIDLTKAHSFDEIVSLVAEGAQQKKEGEWITGRGWHQDKWDRVPMPNVEGLPYHEALSAVSPNNPVYLVHASGHSALVNKRAMEIAGIDKSTPDPPGGTIIKDAQGEPIGALLEEAMGLVAKHIKETGEEKKKEALLAAQECVEKGITTVHDAGASFETIDLYKELVDEGALPLRLWVMIEESNGRIAEEGERARLINYGDKRLTVRAIKRLIDGALGSHGAWLLEPYSDLPESSGINTTPLAELKETARLALKLKLELCIHAIGDRANREVLDLYEQAFKEAGGVRDVRWRIEHAQHLHPADVPKFAELGVTAAMQTVHCTSDAPWVDERLGEARAIERSYLWQSLIKSGALFVDGTDAPVEDVDPIANFYAGITRQTKDGSRFNEKESLSREQVLRAYTLNGAIASFEEQWKGSLEPGKLADITILSGDIMTVPESDILAIKVRATIVGGKIVYEKNL